MFQALIQGLVQQAVEVILDDLPVVVTYTDMESTDYDPVSGTNTRAVGTYTFKAVASKFGVDEVDTTIDVKTDIKLIVPFLSLPIEPTLDDTCTFSGREWVVQRNLGVPGSSLWKIHVRSV